MQIRGLISGRSNTFHTAHCNGKSQFCVQGLYLHFFYTCPWHGVQTHSLIELKEIMSVTELAE